MVISFHKQPLGIPPISLEGVETESVKSVQFLGIIVTDEVTWNKYNLDLFQRFQASIPSKLDSEDLIAFYGSVIRPVLEYGFWSRSGFLSYRCYLVETLPGQIAS